MLHKLSFALLFAVLTCGQIGSAEVQRPGRCYKMDFMEQFDLNAFKGIWYEQARYPNSMEGENTCVYNTYTPINKGTLRFKYSGLTASKQPVSINATGRFHGQGVLFIDFGSGITRRDEILGTDYKSWAAVYSCRDVGDDRIVSAWVLTRKRNADDDTINKAKQNLTKNGAYEYNLEETIQDDCPHQE